MVNIMPLAMPAIRNAKGKQRIPKFKPPKKTRSAASFFEMWSAGGGRKIECTELRHTATPLSRAACMSCEVCEMFECSLFNITACLRKFLAENSQNLPRSSAYRRAGTTSRESASTPTSIIASPGSGLDLCSPNLGEYFLKIIGGSGANTNLDGH